MKNVLTRGGLSKREKLMRGIVWAAAVTFCLVTAIVMIASGNYSRLFACFGSVALLTVPFVAMKLLRFEMSFPMFVFAELYCLGPFLGNGLNLYYHLFWWDDLLHTVGGVVFAILGAYLIKFLNGGGRVNVFVCALFAFCFSVTVSAMWEFTEYFLDAVTHSDLQTDAVVGDIYSYILGGGVGEVGSLEGITEVTVNGVPLGVGGYIDIGLHDTMRDMLVETLGALVYVVYHLIDRDRHPLIYPVGGFAKRTADAEESQA